MSDTAEKWKPSVGTGGLDGLDVVVLAGGLGSRIRSVLGDTPKVLAPVMGRTFLDHLLERLAKLGAGRIILSLGYRAEAVQAHLAAVPPPLPVVCVVEDQPLGTAGGLRLAFAAAVSAEVMVINGDTWLDTDYAAFVASHRRQGRDCSILCVAVEDASRYGSVAIDAEGGVRGFVEKGGALGPGVINGGVYLFGRTARAALAAAEGPSLEHDFFACRPPSALHGFRAGHSVFLDIGTPASLAAADGVIGQAPLTES